MTLGQRIRRVLRAHFGWISVWGTAFVFAFMWIVGQIGIQTEAFDMIGEAIGDYELADDIYYRKLRASEDVPFDDRIVLVNVGPKGPDSRVTLAKQIEILAKYEPKVIGIDALFDQKTGEEAFQDTLLARAVSKVPNFVFSSELALGNPETGQWDTLLLPPPLLLGNAHTGHANTGNEEEGDFIMWRSIPPKEQIKGGRTEVCLAAKMAELYDPAAAKAFLARANDRENIYFKGNLEKYTRLDVENVLNEQFDGSIIKDKIVLIGYMGSSYTDYHWDEDKFYTPLNKVQIGRAYPDMYGVVIHANIISMILDRKCIDVSPDWVNWCVAILLCYLNVAIFSFILARDHLAIWYTPLSKGIQLGQLFALVGLTIFLFYQYNYKIELSLAVAVIALSGDLVEIWLDIIVKGIERKLKKH